MLAVLLAPLATLLCESLADVAGVAPADDVEAIVGVAPSEQLRYACQGESCSFTCFSGHNGEPFPRSVVNDNFCDCADGSDEPGTSACAGQSRTLFHCSWARIGTQPRSLFTSRVGDGICDCCDGSDESSREPRCPNTCDQETQEHAKLVERLRAGLAKHQQIKKQARKDRTAWKNELAELQQRKSAAEEATATSQAASEDTPLSIQEKRFAALESKVSDLQAVVRKQQQLIDGLLADAKQRGESGAMGAKVSEYAKWMDNADTLLSGEAAPPSAHSDAAVPVEISPEAPPSSEPPSDPQALQEELDTIDAKVAELQAKLDALPEDKLGYHSLLDTCLSAQLEGYEYKICFFKDAHQDSVSLGTWSGWSNRRQGMFKGGLSCGDGVVRELRVVFTCGDVQELVEVTEPSVCWYKAIVTAPGACGKRSAQEVQKADSAAASAASADDGSGGGAEAPPPVGREEL